MGKKGWKTTTWPRNKITKNQIWFSYFFRNFTQFKGPQKKNVFVWAETEEELGLEALSEEEELGLEALSEEEAVGQVSGVMFASNYFDTGVIIDGYKVSRFVGMYSKTSF